MNTSERTFDELESFTDNSNRHDTIEFFLIILNI